MKDHYNPNLILVLNDHRFCKILDHAGTWNRDIRLIEQEGKISWPNTNLRFNYSKHNVE